VLDNLAREAVAAVAERSHAAILSDTRLAPEFSATMPDLGIKPKKDGPCAPRMRKARIRNYSLTSP
jgi:hypothetical protein